MAFNNDTFIALEFQKLRDEFSIDTVIETGTFVGDTTIWLADNFKTVHTIEIDNIYLNKAKAQCKNHDNIIFHLGNSGTSLNDIISNITGENIFVFLDAHWGKLPLTRELDSMANNKQNKYIIAIHDFFVPGCPKLGYDSYNNQPLEFNWLKSHFNKIYNNKFIHYYNSMDKADGAMRGIIYLKPSE